MSLRAIGGRLFKHGTAFIRPLPKGKLSGKTPTRAISNSVAPIKQPSTVPSSNKTDSFRNDKYHVLRNIGSQIRQKARRVLIDDVLNQVPDRFRSETFQKVSQRVLYGTTTPLLGLVGVAAIDQGLVTKNEELEGICWEIRECMSKIRWTRDNAAPEITPEDASLSLQSFDFGKPIAKGANAVVYSVKLASDQASRSEHSENRENFPLALKMMFNYDIQSNSLAILKAMYRETVPSPVYYNRQGIADYEYEFLNMTRHLPCHPNIVKIISVFTDYVPELESCREMYPMALPKRIDPQGEGRNMSLFILMNKYDKSLQEFLRNEENLSVRTSVLLLTQLLEGVVHMVNHNIAHRDLKADNVLLDLTDPKSPLAVISDFGCCLAEKSASLSVPYANYDTDKGGNTALMAPEIISKKPGPFSRLEYHKSDLWAVGALAYEIFGAKNPFYGNKTSDRLSSLSYRDEDLPRLPEGVPPLIGRLVKNLLRRDPSERLTPDVAANVCQLFLWGPSSWLERTVKFPTYREILEWLLNLATKILCESGTNSRIFYESVGQNRKLNSSEYLLISTFLCRAKLQNVSLALAWIREEDM